jgi:hypothetical protein
MLDWINAHGLLSLSLFYLFSTAVGRLPSPQPGGAAWYAFLYGWLHDISQLVAGNAFRIPAVRSLLGGGNSLPPVGGGPTP